LIKYELLTLLLYTKLIFIKFKQDNIYIIMIEEFLMF